MDASADEILSATKCVLELFHSLARGNTEGCHLASQSTASQKFSVLPRNRRNRLWR